MTSARQRGFIALPIWLLTFGRGALNFLAAVPRPVWYVLGAALALWLYTGWIDRGARKDERAKVNATWEEKERVADARFAAEMNRKRGEVADWVLAGLATRDAHARELRESEIKHEAAFTDLANRRRNYVTEKAVRDCPVTRGMVMQFNSGAARANGTVDPAPAPDPAPGVADAPAGIALDRYTGRIEDTQAALGSCRGQVLGWQRHWSDVTAWYAGLARILESCFPKGASQ